ncbi:NADPH-dependent FMN reductase [Saccharobesus litoralis]|uniref:NADPH-dependent FMN reductase n=1 Tax=Saccharobesus litoralis TaxID=2172099 RepID=A0A2S0VM72_9ALTE|nr:NAD(P)H-dependent oxidoreductase [Saccharobesus litoralis]AWB65314.1 NADPH-dependent FMN reductase [Saccharobesus litoralis]
MKLLTFAASNSATSINKQLAVYAANLLSKQTANIEIEVLDINDYEMPIYSPEREQQLGQHKLAQNFRAKIAHADAIIIAFAEHNGSYTAAYKNLFDWTSRIDMKVYQNKPMVLLATSPGPGGAKNVLNTAVNSMPYFAGDVKGSLSIPSFFDNFDVEQQKLRNEDLASELAKIVSTLL